MNIKEIITKPARWFASKDADKKRLIVGAGIGVVAVALVGTAVVYALVPAGDTSEPVATDDSASTYEASDANDAQAATDLTDADVVSLCTGTMTFDGADVSVPATDTVSVTDNAGSVMVVETVSDTSDLASLVSLATRRAASLAATLADDTVGGSATTSITWTLVDPTGTTIYAVTYAPATAPTTGSNLQNLLSTATGHTMSDAASAAVAGAGATVDASAGTVTTPTGTAVAAGTATASSATASGASGSGQAAASSPSGSGSSGASGSSSSSTGSSGSSGAGSGSSDSGSGSSPSAPSGHWETVTVTPAYDETVVDTPATTRTEPVVNGQEYVCTDGYTTTSITEMQNHIDTCSEANPNFAYGFTTQYTYATKTVDVPAVTHPVHHDAVTQQVWVSD